MPLAMDLPMGGELGLNDELLVCVQCVDEQENIQNANMDI
jgi:hypothetical protein